MVGQQQCTGIEIRKVNNNTKNVMQLDMFENKLPPCFFLSLSLFFLCKPTLKKDNRNFHDLFFFGDTKTKRHENKKQKKILVR